MFMTMDYNISNDTTIMIPMKLDMYNNPETYVKSDNQISSGAYKIATDEYSGKATEVTGSSSLTDGNYKILSFVLSSRKTTLFKFH